MTSVIGVRFKKAGKVYYFAPGQLAPAVGDYVIVETARGEECGEVAKPVHEVPDSKISKPLRPALRMADAIDLRRMEKNRADEKRAFDVCAERIEKHKLDMKLVDGIYAGPKQNFVLFHCRWPRGFPRPCERPSRRVPHAHRAAPNRRSR